MEFWKVTLLMLSSMVVGACCGLLGAYLVRLQRQHKAQSNSSGNVEWSNSSGNFSPIVNDRSLGHSTGVEHSTSRPRVMYQSETNADWFADEWTDARHEEEWHTAMGREHTRD